MAPGGCDENFKIRGHRACRRLDPRNPGWRVPPSRRDDGDAASSRAVASAVPWSVPATRARASLRAFGRSARRHAAPPQRRRQWRHCRVAKPIRPTERPGLGGHGAVRRRRGRSRCLGDRPDRPRLWSSTRSWRIRARSAVGRDRGGPSRAPNSGSGTALPRIPHGLPGYRDRCRRPGLRQQAPRASANTTATAILPPRVSREIPSHPHRGSVEPRRLHPYHGLHLDLALPPIADCGGATIRDVRMAEQGADRGSSTGSRDDRRRLRTQHARGCRAQPADHPRFSVAERRPGHVRSRRSPEPHHRFHPPHRAHDGEPGPSGRGPGSALARLSQSLAVHRHPHGRRRMQSPSSPPDPSDKRFKDKDWSENQLFDFIKQSLSAHRPLDPEHRPWCSGHGPGRGRARSTSTPASSSMRWRRRISSPPTPKCCGRRSRARARTWFAASTT